MIYGVQGQSPDARCMGVCGRRPQKLPYNVIVCL